MHREMAIQDVIHREEEEHEPLIGVGVNRMCVQPTFDDIPT